MIALFKALHIAGMALWCAGLIVLPVLLHVYGRKADLRTQSEFSEFRLLVHAAYVALVTPAALVAIAAGTVLIFLTGLTEAWLMLKLAFVAGMVLVHAWLGHLSVQSAEGRGAYRMPQPLLALPLATFAMAAVLVLVLAKPDLAAFESWLPGALRAPQDRPLPSFLVPI